MAPILAALLGCAQSGIAPVEQARLVWPEAPAPARVAYVRAFSRPDDLGITRGVLQKLADALFGGSDVRLVRPMAVATVGTALYVADPGARGVHRLDPAKGIHVLIRGERGAPLPSPVALAVGAGGDVYVSDSALARVFVIRPDADTAVPVTLDFPLRQPTGIAFDPEAARLVVVDTATHRLLFFNSDGSLAASVGRRGTGAAEFNYPTLLWRARDGRFYVTDSLNFRIQIFDPRGAFVSQFGRAGDGSGDLARQKGVATDSYGHIYVVDALFNAVQVFDPSGRFLLSVGQLGSDRGEFWLPTGLHIADDDTIYVADSHNRRVQVLRYVGGAD